MTTSKWRTHGLVPLIGVGATIVAALAMMAVAAAPLGGSGFDDQFARDRWPPELANMNDDAEALVVAATGHFGSYAVDGALGISRWCGADEAATSGWGSLGTLPLPDHDDPMPSKLADILTSWQQADHRITRTAWTTDYENSGRRPIATVRTNTGVTLDIGVQPIDQAALKHETWTPSALRVYYEYETDCVEF